MRSETGALVAGARRQRGWGKLRLVSEMRRADQRRGQSLPADASVKRRIASWENGHSTPDEFYGTLLCEAPGLTAAERAKRQTALDPRRSNRAPEGSSPATPQASRRTSAVTSAVKSPVLSLASPPPSRTSLRRAGGPSSGPATDARGPAQPAPVACTRKPPSRPSCACWYARATDSLTVAPHEPIERGGSWPRRSPGAGRSPRRTPGAATSLSKVRRAAPSMRATGRLTR
jgi:hypothetical protein